jgi:DnaJ domain
MFDRNRQHAPEQTTVSVAMTLTDGSKSIGKLTVPMGRSVIDALNGPAAFIEFEPFGEDSMLIAKASVVTATPLRVPAAPNLNARLRDADGFDPYTVLDLLPTASWDEVRHAYIALAKDYHPDRYNAVELPAEVTAYLAAMARRVNAAYAALELSYALKRQSPAVRQEPIYTSPAMRG